MSKDTKDVQKFEFKAEIKQLLNLIVHSLYTHPEVFLRELISNSSDALNKVRFLKLTDGNIIDPDAELDIKIQIDEKEGSFIIEDTGIGMTKEELVNNIGTIAKSGTIEFLQTLKTQDKNINNDLIGKFGVGFYSIFMVTDEVSIETRHSDKDSKGFLWKSAGEGDFTIEEIDRKTRGTRISFKFKDTAKEFAHEYKIKEIINKYSNFADFPINLGKERVNTVTALWHKKSSEIKPEELNEFYKFISNDFEEPLGHLQLSLEGVVNFKALLFIPKKAPLDLLRVQNEKSLHLYSNKILIQNDCKDILPEYLRFASGVVDTVDLPLNVSREITQNSPVMAKIRNILTTKMLAYLQGLADKEKDKYDQFYKNFGPLFKSGVNSDFANKEKITDLLRFETSQKPKGELVSLKEYVSRMDKDQKDIYYVSGESRDALERNPNLEYFSKHKIEVLLLSEPMDVFIIPTIPEFDKKKITSIDKSDIDLKPADKIDKPDTELTKSLVALFKDTLKDRVEDVVVSKRLVESPVTLVAGKESMDPQMERMMKMMQKDFKGSKRIMEVNLDHPVLKNLQKMYIGNSENPLIKKCVLQLFEGALFLEGELPPSGDFVKRMTELLEEATK